MATNLAIDTELLNLAKEVGEMKTKKETVNQALREFVAKRKQLEIIDLFGKLDPDSDYDYKKSRQR
jgi:Arc/MetJ family transcription regulator